MHVTARSTSLDAWRLGARAGGLLGPCMGCGGYGDCSGAQAEAPNLRGRRDASAAPLPACALQPPLPCTGCRMPLRCQGPQRLRTTMRPLGPCSADGSPVVAQHLVRAIPRHRVEAAGRGKRGHPCPRQSAPPSAPPGPLTPRWRRPAACREEAHPQRRTCASGRTERASAAQRARGPAQGAFKGPVKGLGQLGRRGSAARPRGRLRCRCDRALTPGAAMAPLP
jgi:hypothetical protein